MKFCIITHTPHNISNEAIRAYAPYVREINLWLKHVNAVKIVAPSTSEESSIFSNYRHYNIKLNDVLAFSITSTKELLKTMFRLPKIIYTIYTAMRNADHIHLRCPGNMGLLGCMVQMFFPKTPKTVKYAGNWDPKAKQPWSYKLQKLIVSNTSITKNCTVLVYGDWPNQTENIKAFFTATYSEKEKEPLKVRDYSKTLRFLFVGTLSKGKQPFRAIQLVENLIKSGREATLEIYGEGEQKDILEQYIKQQHLSDKVIFKGNKASEKLKKAYQAAHFLILPSKSEGWPKVVAEAMFWGCIPITTPVSCVPWMLDYGNRGFLLLPGFNFQKALDVPNETLMNMSKRAAAWSRSYTLERFEDEIQHLIS